jgi:hypothetical protein
LNLAGSQCFLIAAAGIVLAELSGCGVMSNTMLSSGASVNETGLDQRHSLLTELLATHSNNPRGSQNESADPIPSPEGHEFL